jgi:hypothetical protein
MERTDEFKKGGRYKLSKRVNHKNSEKRKCKEQKLK